MICRASCALTGTKALRDLDHEQVTQPVKFSTEFVCDQQLNGRISFEGTNEMLVTSDVQKKKVEGLRARRKPLFDWYEKNPNETHLVLEIKSIDDQIAECKQQMDKEKRNRN
jgi:hypothetical protein